MNNGFSTRGAESVLSMLERVREDTLHSAAMSGVEAGLQMLCAQARMLCPADTGELRESIAVRMTQDGGEVYAGAPHAVHVEMGTAEKPAQPFLYPAFCVQENEMVLGVFDTVTRQVKGYGS